jgi:hypothetical protein
VIAMTADDEEAKARARKIMKTSGARFITYFGPLVTEVLDT